MSYYYLTAKGEQRGPIEIHEFAAHGINAYTLVWRQGMPAWQPAGACPELAGQITGAASAGNICPPPTPASAHINGDGVKRPGKNLLLNIFSWVLVSAAVMCPIGGFYYVFYSLYYSFLISFPMLMLSATLGILSLVKSRKAIQYWQGRKYDKMEDAASTGKTLALIGFIATVLYFLFRVVAMFLLF